MSTRQWLQQRLLNLELASSVQTQREGKECPNGPETVAAWDVMSSIQERMQHADDEHLLHPPLIQDWVLTAGTNGGSVTSFIQTIARCLASLRSCQMLARCSNGLAQSPC